MSNPSFDTDVLVLGSGFGGSVAALRWAEAGRRVTVLERGPWVRREDFEADPDAFWNPRRHRFGMNDLRARGRHVIPWLGAGVGGGSHVYAATLKRRDTFDGFPKAINKADMDRYYAIAEDVMDAQRYPDHPPYSDVRPTQLLYSVAEQLAQTHPDLVEDWGPINLGISFAPEGTSPGTEFVNKHGAQQRYSDPFEQSLLGGDIGAKNSLDKNYLHLAQQSGAEIRPLHQADRIEPLDGGGYRVHFTRFVRETSALRRTLRNFVPGLIDSRDETGSLTTERLVVACGAVGSTELLLRNRDVHATLPSLSSRLGQAYTTNGDFISLIFPFRGLFVSWAGLIGAVIALLWLDGSARLGLLVAGAVLYFAGLVFSRRTFDPDIGVTNSDYIKFRGRDGSGQGAYIESGRYPTPVRAVFAFLMSVFGVYRPRRYRWIVLATRALRLLVPPFELIARTWPIPLLQMGRDDAVGSIDLDRRGRARIDYPFATNVPFYHWLNRLGKLVARAANAYWAPNFPAFLLKKIEVPHNQGGCPMGESAADGVVDDAGQVFGYPDMMVLDGSIIPCSVGPNPALTILALSERAMAITLDH